MSETHIKLNQDLNEIIIQKQESKTPQIFNNTNYKSIEKVNTRNKSMFEIDKTTGDGTENS